MVSLTHKVQLPCLKAAINCTQRSLTLERNQPPGVNRGLFSLLDPQCHFVSTSCLRIRRQGSVYTSARTCDVQPSVSSQDAHFSRSEPSFLVRGFPTSAALLADILGMQCFSNRCMCLLRRTEKQMMQVL